MEESTRNEFQNSINSALDGKMTWEKLASTLDKLTSSVENMKNLIEILLETLKRTNTKLKSFEMSGQVGTNEELSNQPEVEDSKDFPKTLIHHDATKIKQYPSIEQESLKFHHSTNVKGKKIVVPQLTLKKVIEKKEIVPNKDLKIVTEDIQPKVKVNQDDFQYIVGDLQARSDFKQESIDLEKRLE